MKKNAILVASILFVAAGCAHQGSNSRAGMDAGTGAGASVQSGTYSTESISRYPDGTIRTPATEIDMSADSSVRGGTLRARGVDPYHSSLNAAESDSDLSASSMPDDQSGIVDSQPFTDRDDFDQSGAASWDTDKAGDSVRASANWNASDDLLQDGPLSGEEALIRTEDSSSAVAETREITDFDATSDSPVSGHTDLSSQEESGLGSAASSESGSSSSDAEGNVSPDLNSSENLEQNISGEVDLEQSPSSSDLSGEEADHAGESAVTPQVGVTANEPEWLFENNRAQGVGSAATGEFGVATSRDPLAPSQNLDARTSSDQQLEDRVKRRLVMESTGTHGLMRHDLARNVEVTAQKGTVTLKGSVPSESDRKTIEVRAAEIPGVHRVNNQLIVTPAADPANRDLGSGSNLEERRDRLQD